MIQIISGEKGKGKTKILLDKVNTNVKEAKGTLVYLDKNTKHMYELSNKVRLINVRDYLIENSDEFIGFISGIASQDNDLEKIYLDSFLSIACLEGKDITPVISKLDLISAKFNFDLIISISIPAAELPEIAKDKVIVAL
jgi:hypothetical protein